ncbi:MAG: glutamate--tRNA ligase [Alphaproteobacteria bacterium]
MTVVTRFAPSPTGFLHIGGARTALFNWLYTRKHGGQFRLRIEDTDRARSTQEATEAIYDGLRWLGLDWDGDAVSQAAGGDRHAEVAREMLANGHAYHCYCSPEELTAMREKAKAEKRPMRYDGTWRDRDPAEAPAGIDPVIRLKAPRTGETVIEDLVQGRVVVQNAELDDMVLLRADGTATYMLAVVVDDHDMGISHVIRGDDHLNNAFRQAQVFRAMGWDLPAFAHIPLIHGPDGAKMSKRHGALGVGEYRDMGYLPEAMRNYLLRLGWGHGDDEIISTEQAIQWFDVADVGKGAARFDFDKLLATNYEYLRHSDDDRLVELLAPFLKHTVDETGKARLRTAMPSLKERAKTLVELAESAAFLFDQRPLAPDEKAAKLLGDDGLAVLRQVRDALGQVSDWQAEALESATKGVADAAGVKLGKVAQPLRAALTGRTTSPGIYDVLLSLGREESLGRLDDALS